MGKNKTDSKKKDEYVYFSKFYFSQCINMSWMIFFKSSLEIPKYHFVWFSLLPVENIIISKLSNFILFYFPLNSLKYYPSAISAVPFDLFSILGSKLSKYSLVDSVISLQKKLLNKQNKTKRWFVRWKSTL